MPVKRAYVIVWRMHLTKLSLNIVCALRTTTTTCNYKVNFIDLYLVFLTNFRMLFLLRTQTVILLLIVQRCCHRAWLPVIFIIHLSEIRLSAYFKAILHYFGFNGPIDLDIIDQTSCTEFSEELSNQQRQEPSWQMLTLLSMTACLNLDGVRICFLWFLVYLNFLSRFHSLHFSLSAPPRKYSIDVSFPSHECNATCTLDPHSKTAPSGLDSAQSVERFM